MPEQRPPSGKKIAGVSRKWWLIGGGAMVVVVYYSYRKAKSNVAATTPSTDSTTSPGIDPMTGLPYDASSSSPYGQYGFSPVGSPYAGLSPFGSWTAPAPETNKEWYQHAVAALEQHGYTAAAASGALAEYLLGLPLTPTQVATVEAAIALVGPPPSYVGAHLIAPPSTAAPATPTLAMTTITGHRVQATASRPPGAALFEWRMGSMVPSVSPSNVHTSGVYPVGYHYGPLTVRAVSSSGKTSAWSAPATTVVR